MGLKIVGAGFGRTGTHSLKFALEKLLGAPCYHMVDVFAHPEHVPAWHAAALDQPVDWDKLFDGYAAAVDWPASAYWPQLMKKYPDALVLLSVRDPEAWWKSATETIFKGMNNPNGMLSPEWLEMIRAMFARYGATLEPNHDVLVAAFKENIERAKREVPRERLLVWEAKDGWRPICARLGLPVPSEPFPRSNTTEEWRAREAAMEAAKAAPAS